MVIAQKKASKNDKVPADLAALPEMSQIRIRNQSGVFEVSLVKVWEERGTVEVLWDGSQRREFRWGSIVWSSHGQTMGSKPTAEGTYPSFRGRTGPALTGRAQSWLGSSSSKPRLPLSQLFPQVVLPVRCMCRPS